MLGARRMESPSGSAPLLLCSFGRGTVLLGPPGSYPQNKALDPDVMGACFDGLLSGFQGTWGPVAADGGWPSGW